MDINTELTFPSYVVLFYEAILVGGPFYEAILVGGPFYAAILVGGPFYPVP